MRVLVTGSSRGIGLSIAKKLLKEGHKVTGTSRSKDHDLSEEKNYEHLVCNFADPKDVEKLKSIFDGEGSPEAVVNNAGMFEEADFDASDEDWLTTWDKTLQVNTRSAAMISKWALNAWKANNVDGRLINISSRAGTRGDTQEFAAYAASKGALTAFTKSIARSFGKHGITAYTIAPGFVNTDMAQGSIEVYGEEYLTKDLALNAIAPPEEIAEIVYLLAQGKLKHATGQTFHVNSGSYLVG